MKQQASSSPSSKAELIKSRVSLALPFALFAVGVFLVSLFVFKTYVEGSAIWDFVFAEVPVIETVDSELNYIGVQKLDRDVKPEAAPEDQKVPNVVLPVLPDTETYDYIPTLPELKEGHCISSSAVGGFSLGSYWATISVEDDERVDEIPVYQGDNSALLSVGVGHLYGSCFPGQGGVCVLAGHVSGKADYFANLADADIYKRGTQIKLDTAYGVYIYEVIDTEILNYKDTKYVKRYTWVQTGKDENGNPVGHIADQYGKLTDTYDADELLVMYTCYPKGVGFRTQRYYVICRRIYGYSWR